MTLLFALLAYQLFVINQQLEPFGEAQAVVLVRQLILPTKGVRHAGEFELTELCLRMLHHGMISLVLMEAFRAPDIFMGLGEMYGAFTGRTVQAILIGFQDRFDLSKSIQPLLIRHATGGLKSFHRITS